MGVRGCSRRGGRGSIDARGDQERTQVEVEDKAPLDLGRGTQGSTGVWAVWAWAWCEIRKCSHSMGQNAETRGGSWLAGKVPLFSCPELASTSSSSHSHL